MYTKVSSPYIYFNLIQREGIGIMLYVSGLYGSDLLVSHLFVLEVALMARFPPVIVISFCAVVGFK